MSTALFIVVANEKYFDKLVFARKPVTANEVNCDPLYAFASWKGDKNYESVSVYTEEEAIKIINTLDGKAKYGLESMWVENWEMIQVS